MTKKVSFGAKSPRNAPAVVDADEWVNGGKLSEQDENGSKGKKAETTRFTIDIPVELHSRIKSQCAQKRVKMRDEIQAVLEKHFPIN